MTRVAVVGGGAAGLVAAHFAARAGAEVVLLEGSKACGRKILASGGGRCNVLPSEASVDDFHTSGSRNVLKRLLRTWRLPEQRAWFEEELGVALAEEEDTGKLFPVSNQAREVRDALLDAARGAGAEVRVPWRVEHVTAEEGGGFLLREVGGEELRADRVVLATGGRSVPETGSDGHGYELARRLGHEVLTPYPALVPLTSSDRALTDLAGIALPVRWRAVREGKVVEERVRELLFTHRGFSGPAVLDASHHAVRDDAELYVAWLDGTEQEWLDLVNAKARRELRKLLGDLLPKRLVELLLERARLRPEIRSGNLTKGERTRLVEVLCSFRLPVDGDEGFRVAEVTGGGVPLGEVDPSTLRSRCCEGLVLCGEILDVIGRIGGYNFQWAWLTGRLAGESAAA